MGLAHYPGRPRINLHLSCRARNYFFLKLQTGEYSREIDHNLEQADRQEKDLFFKKNYGEENQKNTAWLMREIVHIARKYEREIDEHFGSREKKKDLSAARRLAGKHGFELTAKR